jgi:ubiquinone/menaquinone biosynthesis C-methylase UbiE
MQKGVLACPACGGGLRREGANLKCPGCGASFSVSGDIPIFGSLSDYWCNVSRDKMQLLNKESEESGDWYSTAMKYIPDYIPHLNPLHRADAQFIWPISSESRVLDVGSMWGGLTIPVARYCKEIVALDKTYETLNFLKIRAGQMGLNNIYVVHSPALKLPFSDGSFDFVILNGVLEWLGMEETWIYEEHWEGRWEKPRRYAKTPEGMQLDALREIFRVLKPNGALYVAIENRYGIQYFYTFPDDHNNVRFVTFMPRSLASLISRLCGKGEYRVYVYSPGQLKGLAERGGFKEVQMYGTFPNYIEMEKAYPLDMSGKFRNEITLPQVKALPLLLNFVLTPLLPKGLAKHTTPSLLALCGKSGNKDELVPRVLRIMKKEGIIDNTDDYRVVISNNRTEDYLPTNVVVYDLKDQPVYFCKIARDPRHTGLHDEAENLKWLSGDLADRKSPGVRFPSVVYFGVSDGVTMMVLSFLKGKPVDFWAHYIMNKGFDKIGLTWKPFRRSAEFFEERLFLKRLDYRMYTAIDALIEFQELTSKGKINAEESVRDIMDHYRAERGELPHEADTILLELQQGVAGLPENEIQLCTVHGDYDVLNILVSPDGETGLVDFEHLEKKGMPFFDLANLIFGPLILKWKSGYSIGGSFSEYLRKHGGLRYINRWLSYYSEKSGMPHAVVSHMVKVAVVEQNIKKYPSYRDPYSYPMYGMEMIKEINDLPLSHG